MILLSFVFARAQDFVEAIEARDSPEKNEILASPVVLELFTLQKSIYAAAVAVLEDLRDRARKPHASQTLGPVFIQFTASAVLYGKYVALTDLAYDVLHA